jgi:hypothetical protein
MKRPMHDNSQLTEFFVKAGLVAAIAAALMLPLSINASGNDTAARGERASLPLTRSSWDALPLPPIPHLETMPWLVQERAAKTLKIDTLLAPRFEIGGSAVAHTEGHDVHPSPLVQRTPPSTRDTSWNG